jgi:hypothetical protein
MSEGLLRRVSLEDMDRWGGVSGQTTQLRLAAFRSYLQCCQGQVHTWHSAAGCSTVAGASHSKTVPPCLTASCMGPQLLSVHASGRL